MRHHRGARSGRGPGPGHTGRSRQQRVGHGRVPRLMSELLILILSGAVAGALYAIMASGLVLTYSTSGVFNFAHGAVAFVAAVVYFELHTGAHVPIVPA